MRNDLCAAVMFGLMLLWSVTVVNYAQAAPSGGYSADAQSEYVIAMMLVRDGRFAESLVHFERGMIVGVMDPGYWVAYGIALRGTSTSGEVIEKRRVARVRSSYERMLMLRQARECFVQALKLSKKDDERARIADQMGRLLWFVGSPVDGRSHLGDAAAFSPLFDSVVSAYDSTFRRLCQE